MTDDGIAKLGANEFPADARWGDAVVTRSKPASPSMIGGFVTPALRGVAITGPYGHGGRVPGPAFPGGQGPER